MKPFKKMLSITSKLILAFLISLVFVISPTNSQEVTLHIKLEVSKDGNTWHNYSGSDGGNEETLNCEPGDVLTVRVKIWNTGDANATDVFGNGGITNSSYVESISDVDPDDDGNSREFTEIFFDEFHNGAISQVDFGGTENADYESMTIVFTLSDDFPSGQTIMVGTAAIDGYTLIAGENEPDSINETIQEKAASLFKNLFSQKVYAQLDESIDSQIRLVINAELPATGADLK